VETKEGAPHPTPPLTPNSGRGLFGIRLPLWVHTGWEPPPVPENNGLKPSSWEAKGVWFKSVG